MTMSTATTPISPVLGRSPFAANNDEISQAWKQVEERVLQMAGGDRAKVKLGLGIDDVLQYLDNAQADDRKAAEKYGAVKKIFNRTLQCIQTVGGIVADACQHLQFFVEICDRTMRLRQKRAKFAAFMKQLFLNDDGVQGLLIQMENLVDKENRLVVAQTFRSSNEAAVNSRDNLNLAKKADSKLDSLVNDKNQQKRETETKKQRQTLIKALEFEPSAIKSDTQEPIEHWAEVWSRYKKELVEGTGEWISKDPLFTSWFKGSGSAKPILGLEGGDGAGKTLLTVNIIMLLRKLAAAEISSSRSVVAYYFLQMDSKTTSNKKDIANSVSKSLLWQLAKADGPLLKSAAGICEKAGFFKNHYEDMWTQVLLENEDRINMDSVFFIVIDGLGDDVDALAQLLQKLSVNPARQRTRVLLTGKASTFDLLDKAGGIEFDKIKLEASNARDIELYITARMNGMDMLKDCTRPGYIRSARQDPEHPEDCDRSGDIDEINDHLEAAGKTRPDQIVREIERLNQTRTTREIAEINEIILWINAARVWLDPSEMEGALALRAGKVSGHQTSLLSLESKISTKYSLFHIDNGVIDYKLAEAQDSIPPKKRGRSDDESSSGFKEIQLAEVNMLKHYLSNVCPPDIYKKFGFDDFFKLKLGREGSYICNDKDNAQITLALRCLNCLVEQRTDKTEKMHSYSYNYLYEHLKATDLSLADRDLKAEVGGMLVRLFTEEYGIESLLSPSSSTDREADNVFANQTIPLNWEPWIFSDDGVNLVSTWFKDSAVLELIVEKQLVVAYNAADANRHKVLFELGSKVVAKKLFRGETSERESLGSFVLLVGFLSKWTKEKPQVEEKSNSHNDLWNPTLEEIQLVEDWSQELLGVDKDSLWEAQMASLLLYIHENAEAHVAKAHSEARARKALELDANNWRASYTLGRVVESREEAVAILDGLIERLTTVEAYMRSLDESRSLFQQYIKILGLLGERKEFQSIVLFLEKLIEDTDEETNIITKFVIETKGGISHELRTSLKDAAESMSRWDVLDGLYSKALAGKTQYFDLFDFRRQYGVTLAETQGHEEAGFYTRLAMAKDTKKERAEVIFAKVEALYKMFQTTTDAREDSYFAFARYFHVSGDGLRAKKMLKATVTQALEMLSDDDLENDYPSFWDLGRVFSTLQDEENAFVAWDLMTIAKRAAMADYKVKEKERQELKAKEEESPKQAASGEETSGNDTPVNPEEKAADASDEAEPEMPSMVIAYCDGGCGHKWTYATEMWTCTDDLGQVQFDNKCYEKLQAGTLETKICNKDHTFYYAGKRDETALDGVGEKSIRVGERVITLEEWKSEVKANYVDFEDAS
ncbi:hypothetical protein ONZ43_g335 [Nemania bipapillata]|uniref:Uncharacterized protein n=1 Tax=Nemania bipapillata TaxID=110536 RepID=A0ACC2J8Q1_9PEZI|nr:hypothetical protein ONZ43_g335 [Nemania bipapillata]